ncbi:hypothetical protein [Oceanispirochaeta sp.]|jgi:hypothetical protein|nr:hypothetical protein [Oceanispirochaeta sp.]MDA3956040.1 hypothetical protein [Oceanispirochaeta sp.]
MNIEMREMNTSASYLMDTAPAEGRQICIKENGQSREPVNERI